MAGVGGWSECVGSCGERRRDGCGSGGRDVGGRVGCGQWLWRWWESCVEGGDVDLWDCPVQEVER
eukprot:14293592-Alexandrium_andersonii.AAC.1